MLISVFTASEPHPHNMPTHCSWDSILKRISYHFRVIYFCRARSDHFLILFQSTAPQIAVSPPLLGKGRWAAAGDSSPSGLLSLQGNARPSKEAWIAAVWEQFSLFTIVPEVKSPTLYTSPYTNQTSWKRKGAKAGHSTPPAGMDTAERAHDFASAQHLGCPNPSSKGLCFREGSWRWQHASPEGSVRSLQQSSVPPGLETNSAHRITNLQCQPQKTGTTAAEEGLFLSPKRRKKESGLPHAPRHMLAPHGAGSSSRSSTVLNQELGTEPLLNRQI